MMEKIGYRMVYPFRNPGLGILYFVTPALLY